MIDKWIKEIEWVRRWEDVEWEERNFEDEMDDLGKNLMKIKINEIEEDLKRVNWENLKWESVERFKKKEDWKREERGRREIEMKERKERKIGLVEEILLKEEEFEEKGL